VTVPPGVPEVAVVVAVRTTLAPCTAGFGEALSAVVVAAGALMTSVTAADVLIRKPLVAV